MRKLAEFANRVRLTAMLVIRRTVLTPGNKLTTPTLRAVLAKFALNVSVALGKVYLARPRDSVVCVQTRGEVV
jgi:hypothetical protein